MSPLELSSCLVTLPTSPSPPPPWKTRLAVGQPISEGAALRIDLDRGTSEVVGGSTILTYPIVTPALRVSVLRFIVSDLPWGKVSSESLF